MEGKEKPVRLMIVIPCYNEQEVLPMTAPLFREELRRLTEAGRITEDSRVLSIMAIYIIAPCVIIRSFQIDFTPEVRNGFLMTVAAAVLINVCLLFLTGLYQKIFRLDAVERASVMYANTGNLVIPLVMSIFGDEWVVYASAAMCVQLAFMWTHANHIISGEKGVHWKRILTNVNLVSIAIGLALLLTGIRLPALVQEALAQMSATMGPVNMVMLGMLLAEGRKKERT